MSRVYQPRRLKPKLAKENPILHKEVSMQMRGDLIRSSHLERF